MEVVTLEVPVASLACLVTMGIRGYDEAHMMFSEVISHVLAPWVPTHV